MNDTTVRINPRKTSVSSIQDRNSTRFFIDYSDGAFVSADCIPASSMFATTARFSTSGNLLVLLDDTDRIEFKWYEEPALNREGL